MIKSQWSMLWYNYGRECKILSISMLDNFPNKMSKKQKRKVMVCWVLKEKLL